jgi:hypothetical protein
VTPRWVLTANHCVTGPDVPASPLDSTVTVNFVNGQGTSIATGIHTSQASGNILVRTTAPIDATSRWDIAQDLALVKLDQIIPMNVLLPVHVGLPNSPVTSCIDFIRQHQMDIDNFRGTLVGYGWTNIYSGVGKGSRTFASSDTWNFEWVGGDGTPSYIRNTFTGTTYRGGFRSPLCGISSAMKGTNQGISTFTSYSAAVDDPANQQFLSANIQRPDGGFDGEPLIRTNLIVRGTDNNLYWEHTDNANVTGWQLIGNNGVPLASDPAVASWDKNRIDAFVINSNQTIDHAVSTDGVSFHYWDNWGGISGASSLSSLDVVSTGPGRLDLFVLGSTYYGPMLFHRYWDNGDDSGWQNWGRPPGTVSSGPAATAPRGHINEMSVYLTTLDVVNGTPTSTLWQLSNPNSNAVPTGAWRSWGSPGPGVVFAGDPDAASYRSVRTDLFIADTSGKLWHFFTDLATLPHSGFDTTFMGQPSVGIRPNPSVVARGVNSLRVFVAGPDGMPWEGDYHFGPMGWIGLGGAIIGGGDASSW